MPKKISEKNVYHKRPQSRTKFLNTTNQGQNFRWYLLVVVYLWPHLLYKSHSGFNFLWVSHIKNMRQSYYYQKCSYEMIASACCSIFNFNVKCIFLIGNTIVSSKFSPTDHDFWLVIFWLVAGFVEKYSGDSRSRCGKKQVAAQLIKSK